MLRSVVEAGGRKRTVEATVTEPVPGRTLVEKGSGIETTFTVESIDAGGTRVKFDTFIDEGGLQGIVNRLFVGRILGPIYDEELRRLEAYARAHGGVPAPIAIR